MTSKAAAAAAALRKALCAAEQKLDDARVERDVARNLVVIHRADIADVSNERDDLLGKLEAAVAQGIVESEARGDYRELAETLTDGRPDAFDTTEIKALAEAYLVVVKTVAASGDASRVVTELARTLLLLLRPRPGRVDGSRPGT